MEPLFNQFGKYAVQKAIDALRENGGGQVRIPAGVHETVGLELYSNSAPDDVRTLELTPEETDGEEELESYQKVWTGNLDVTGIDLTDVTAKLWVTIINGNTYEAGTLTGDLTKHLKDS